MNCISYGQAGVGAGLAPRTGKGGSALHYGPEKVTEVIMTRLIEMKGLGSPKASAHISQGGERHLHGSLVPPGSPSASQAGLRQRHRQRPPSLAASQPGSPYRPSWDTL